MKKLFVIYESEYELEHRTRSSKNVCRYATAEDILNWIVNDTMSDWNGAGVKSTAFDSLETAQAEMEKKNPRTRLVSTNVGSVLIAEYAILQEEDYDDDGELVCGNIIDSKTEGWEED